jgi:DinB superfamily
MKMTMAVMGVVAIVAVVKLVTVGNGQAKAETSAMAQAAKPDAATQGQAKAPGAATPQGSSAAAPAPDMTPVANPVSTFVKTMEPRFEKNMVGAAEAMPAEKYSFKPSAEMNSYGHLVMHIAQSNNTFCSKISGQTAPDVKITETDSKETLVKAVKDSFAFCTTALASVDDSKLGEQSMLFGNRPASRGAMLVMLGGGWTDHYAAQAIYLRLNGILPPTAQPKKE